MPLQEEFERSGSWLFRWRSYLPLAFVGVLLLAMGEYRYPGDSETLDHLWEGFCLLVSFFGFVIRIATVGYTAEATSGRNTPAFIPRFKNYRKPDLPFSWKKVLRKEYN